MSTLAGSSPILVQGLGQGLRMPCELGARTGACTIPPELDFSCFGILLTSVMQSAVAFSMDFASLLILSANTSMLSFHKI